MVAYSCTHMYMYMNTVNTAAPESETACNFFNILIFVMLTLNLNQWEFH